jgi:hypothetical protein
MNKRQRKKEWKKNTPEEYRHCQNCYKPLDFECGYHMRWGTCDAYCYGVLVGVYV